VRLDPIDWATYEPYLYANKERAAARCQVRFTRCFLGLLSPNAAAGRPAGSVEQLEHFSSSALSCLPCLQVLFGMLLRGDRPVPPGAAGAAGGGSGGMAADSNILRLSPVGPRFSYLPVSTPVALLRQSSSLQRGSSSTHSELTRLGSGIGMAAALGGAAGAGATGSEVSAAAYSFSSLLTPKAAGGRQNGEEGDSAGGGGSAAAAVGSGVGKLVGSLQGLLGERAAEVTSALGDMSMTQGLLSSFSSRFNK
jgi:hypothetical protein